MNISINEQTGLVHLTHRIFSADDDPLVRSLIEEMLKEDYEITAFESGKILVEYLNTHEDRPDLYILDINMPGLNGIETARQIRKTDASTPIMALSADLNDTVYRGLFEQGFYEAMSKPFSHEVLMGKVRNALENAVIPNYKRMIDLFAGAIAYMGDARDSTTQYHTLRIGEICYLLAEELGLGKQISGNLRIASRLHDIGKIRIRDDVLQKPAKLTNSEFDHIKTHTTEGAAILENFSLGKPLQLLTTASIIALLHHEKLDGSGYPYGKKDGEIPEYVKIVTVVDIFDASTMERPYHPPRPFETGVKILEEEVANGKIDGDVVSAFIRREADISEIRHIYN